MERDKPAPRSGATKRRYERPRGGQARAISELMPQVGRAAFRRFGFIQSSVVSRWPEIVGPHHAKICAPESIRFPLGEKSEGILQLVVVPAHAPFIQQVTEEIIERVNRFFGWAAIGRIALRQAPLDRPEPKPRRQPPDPAEVERVAATLGPIADEALRDALARLGAAIKRN